MKFSGIIVGVVMACVLLAMMGLARLMVPDVKRTEYEVREMEISTLPEPPPPPPEEPPPPPALTSVAEVPDPTRIAIPKAEVPLDLRTPVDSFFTDVEPAPLPQPVVRKAPPSPRPSKPRISKPKAPPAPATKSHYSLGELDSKPRLIRFSKQPFPSSLARRGVRRGTVVFEVELSERGRVRVRRVISASHQELVTPARRIASSASYTAPTRNGQRVKAIMRWPITITK